MLRAITIASGDSGFVDFTFKLNLKVAGKKYGKQVGPIQSYLKITRCRANKGSGSKW